MNADLAFRAAAVVAAVALVGAPYWSSVAQATIAAAKLAYDAAKQRRKGLTRCAAAALIVVAAWGKVPMPSLHVPSVQPVEIETPSAEMQAIVADVAKAMAGMNPVDRALWAETWNKAAVVVAGDGVSPETAFMDTKALRAFTTLALDIAWRRIGGHTPGSNEALRTAVESAYAKALGVAEVSVTKDLRNRYAEFAKAMAWAGFGRG